jgi:sigma-B regulation protein RsbU (phosphoserine phosphatase)
MFGKERFRNIIKKNARAGSSDIVNAVYYELNQFTRGRKSEDDITLVIIKADGL